MSSRIFVMTVKNLKNYLCLPPHKEYGLDNASAENLFGLLKQAKGFAACS